MWKISCSTPLIQQWFNSVLSTKRISQAVLSCGDRLHSSLSPTSVRAMLSSRFVCPVVQEALKKMPIFQSRDILSFSTVSHRALKLRSYTSSTTDSTAWTLESWVHSGEFSDYQSLISLSRLHDFDFILKHSYTKEVY